MGEGRETHPHKKRKKKKDKERSSLFLRKKTLRLGQKRGRKRGGAIFGGGEGRFFYGESGGGAEISI